MPIKLPNWLRICWWLALLGLLTYFLSRRYPDLVSGHAVAADIFVFLVWTALLLVPVFKEVGFFGVTLKQEIKEAKNELKEQILDLKADVRNTVDVRSHINVYPGPPPDAALPNIEEQLRHALRRELGARHLPSVQAIEPKADVPDDAVYLFSVRYALERELRRLLHSRLPDFQTNRQLGPFQLTRVLAESEILSREVAHAITEVAAVCSPAVHAQEISPAKVKFVRDVAPELIAALKTLH